MRQECLSYSSYLPDRNNTMLLTSTVFVLLAALCFQYSECAAPTRSPTKLPTKVPSRAPTNAPSKAPTCKPSTGPTKAPTLPPTVSGEQQLFAVVGGTSCAESLYYGPEFISESGSADGKYAYYLSTNTASKNIPHTNWLQIVTSDGSTELFRIYWSFTTPKTLAERFTGAPGGSESVFYRVEVAGTEDIYHFSAKWRFSNSASMSANKFKVTTSTCCFSQDDGAWGAGSNTVDGNSNGQYTAQFWGIGNWDSSDSTCSQVYKNGIAYNFGANTKTYMYYFAPVPPSAEPTAAPSFKPTIEPSIKPTAISTRAPTRTPTREPTVKPTFAPTVTATVPQLPDMYELFAVVNSQSCAEGLAYGPSNITVDGAVDANYPAFLSTNTPNKDFLHTEWVQVVTTDGKNELFRIYWSFETPRTLADHFVKAVSVGEKVSFRVVRKVDQAEFKYSGVWWFSNGAGNVASKFTTPTIQPGFSLDDGVWGAGNGAINGNSALYASVVFWGVGNWDNADVQDCVYIHTQGSRASYPNTKTYMYYSTIAKPTAAPSLAPSKAPTVVPTIKPSIMATNRPTSFLVPDTYQLFAVLGAFSCADALYYGPNAITENGAVGANYPAFLSTNTPNKNVLHTEWVQIVTSDGINELFRIYWSFETPRTLADHFVQAVSVGEKVNYRVVRKFDEMEFVYNGIWRFSDGATNLATKFATNTIQYGFSGDDGVWGAGNGNLNGNIVTYAANSFWGVGNWNSADGQECYFIHSQGSRISYPSTKTYLYYSTVGRPSAAPTVMPSRPTAVPSVEPSVKPTPTLTMAPTSKPTSPPTRLPTRNPSAAPTRAPSVAPTKIPTRAPTPKPTVMPLPDSYELFAVLTAQTCAEALYYGPNAITENGAVGANYPAFLSTNTPNKNILHTEWVQIVTSDGINELFRIYWTFETPRTLVDHFVNAVAVGEKVTYRVVKPDNSELFYTGNWRFSDGATNLAIKFATNTIQYGFSGDDGAWGAGTGNINGNSQLYSSASFWGVGNWDSADGQTCYYVYIQGSRSYYGTMKTYMYYVTQPRPSVAPTIMPSRPTTVPSRLPTLSPTRAPTYNPTTTPPPFASSSDELFAIVGGTACAEQLPFGPLAITMAGTVDGKHEHFLSTNTPNKDVLHTGWTQIVTTDGVNELFRIYWTFSVARTLSDHFLYARQYGESVSFRVVEAGTAQEYYYSGTWWFSNGAGFTSSTWNTNVVLSSFSADDGVWGAGNGLINPNGYPYGFQNTQFWGIGNWDSNDGTCSTIYRAGVPTTLYGVNTKVYMFMTTVAGPTQEPTRAPTRPTMAPTAIISKAPSRNPTRAPTRSPSRVPTALPSTSAAPVSLNLQLFAVVGGSSCAESLYFGPQAITTVGSADGQYEYFLSTLVGWNAHKTWLQIVTTDGNTELFRIYWTFNTAKSVPERFSDAVNFGEAVSYRVIDAATKQEYLYSGTWRFSDAASMSVSKFQSSTTKCCFSSDDGAWGAGTGIINGNSYGNTYVSTSYWGIGNYDNSDYTECYKIYKNGGVYSNANVGTKVYMYYDTIDYPTLQPTLRPNRRPSLAPTREPTLSTAISMQAEQQVDGVSYSDYQANQAAFEKVFTLSIASAIAGVNVEDIIDLVVTPVNRRKLSTDITNSEDSSEKTMSVSDTNHLRASANYKETLNGAVSMRYIIEVARNRGLSYAQMSSLLYESVNTNQFTSFLQIFAEMENVPELKTASSTSLYTEDTSQIPPKSESSKKESNFFTVPVIIGFAIGFICIIFGIVYYMTYGEIVNEIYRCLCPCNTNTNTTEPRDPLQDLASLHNQASAPPLADPNISKDINSYFYGQQSTHNNTPGDGNLVVTEDATEQALNSGFSPRDVYSAHRPHAAQHTNNLNYSSDYPSELSAAPMKTLPHSLDPSTSSSATPNPAPLPVAALAVPVTHVTLHDPAIAIAEVYLGEVEEYKE